jgi:hypothetical protein
MPHIVAWLFIALFTALSGAVTGLYVWQARRFSSWSHMPGRRHRLRFLRLGVIVVNAECVASIAFIATGLMPGARNLLEWVAFVDCMVLLIAAVILLDQVLPGLIPRPLWPFRRSSHQ